MGRSGCASIDCEVAPSMGWDRELVYYGYIAKGDGAALVASISTARLRASQSPKPNPPTTKPTPLEPPASHAVADAAREPTPAEAAREAVREYAAAWRRIRRAKGGAA